MNQWAGVVLAAGQGSRMKSRLPKPLHPVCGKEMVRYPVDLLARLGIGPVVVVVSPGNREAIEKVLGDGVEYVIQPRPTGTGDALRLAAESLAGRAESLLVQGADAPLLRTETAARLVEVHLAEGNRMTGLSAMVREPGDLGRVRRDAGGRVSGIVEAAEAGPVAADGEEVNGGVYCFGSSWALQSLSGIEPAVNGEVYLTSLAAEAYRRGDGVNSMLTAEPEELLAVNDRVQLAAVESAQRRRICENWMMEGVTITDPATAYIDAEAVIGQDTVILPNTIVSGRTSIGRDCTIGPNTSISDSQVGDGCRVTASALEGATMEDGADVGPFSHLRPGAYLESGVHVGNYAEIKESRLGRGVLMGHFGYVGDASVGDGSNLGAGLVTCNFDGENKHRTEIGQGAFIGCDTMLVAPVSVGDDAVTGAGAVVINDVPAGRLSVGVPAKLLDKKTKSN